MIADWYCCLPSAEKSMLIQMLALFASGQFYIVKADWDLYWADLTIPAALKRASNMLGWARLTPGTVIIDEIPVDVYNFDLVWMAQVLFVALSPAGLCLEGCFITKFMEEH